jgi:hypothetical protein
VNRSDAPRQPPPAGLFWPAWAAFAVVVLFIDLLDVQAELRDGVHTGWAPVVWEYSSGLSSIVLFPAIWRVARWAWPGDGRPLRLIGVHASASLAFSLLHVAGFVLLRYLVYAMAGSRYHFDLRDFPYEYPRDLIAYGLAAGGLWALGRLLNAHAESAAEPASAQGVSTFDIRDGARTLRVPLSEIAAVSSAGNYVEFNLVDCRKPLMRSTLGAMERQFAPRGFVRIHRSWLVNPERVEAIEPAGSGDFTVTLAGGIKAPLSRRFREALEALRD